MEYNIGDYVKIRNNLVIDKEYGPLTFLKGMDAYEGTAYRVVSSEAGCYRLAGNPYFWSAEMLQLAAPKCYHIGTKVIIRPDLEINRSYGGITVNPDIADLGGRVVEVEDVDMDCFKAVGIPYYLSFAMVDGSLITRAEFEAAAGRAKSIDDLRKALWTC